MYQAAQEADARDLCKKPFPGLVRLGTSQTRIRLLPTLFRTPLWPGVCIYIYVFDSIIDEKNEVPENHFYKGTEIIGTA